MKCLVVFSVYFQIVCLQCNGLNNGHVSIAEKQDIKQTRIGINDAGSIRSRKGFCGMKDWQDLSTHRRRRKRFILRGLKWNKRIITWRLTNLSPYLEALETLFLIDNAFKNWARHTNLMFRRIDDGKADIMITFAGEIHKLDKYSYCSMRFDGPGGDVAHAFYPFAGYDYGGDIHFDRREHFSSNGKIGINFAAAVLHEIGHSLGLMHTNTYYSVMNPDFILDTKGQSIIDLQQDDIFAIQSLYGMPFFGKPNVQRSALSQDSEKKDIKEGQQSKFSNIDQPYATTTRGPEQTTTATARTTTATTQATTNVKHRSITTVSCPTAFNAVFLSKINSNTYVIHGNSMFSLGKNLNKVRLRTSIFKRFQFKSIDAAYVRRKSKDLFVFSGQKYAVFSNEASWKKLGSIYDLGMPLFVKKIDATVVYGRLKNTYFFSGKFYWRFNEVKQKMDHGYPKKIQSIWKGLPTDVDSAVTWRNGVTYFFKGPLYYRINGRTASVEPGYPKPIKNIWTKC